MGAVSLLPLRCPACGNELPAAENDVLFVCPACGHACELRGEALHAVAFARAAAGPDGIGAGVRGEKLLLPFWWYTVSVRLSCPRPEFAGVIERMSAIRHMFVAAFAMRGSQAFGDPGLALTRHFHASRAEPALDPAPGGGAVVLGGSRSSEDARKWAPLMLLSQIDRAVDVSHVKMSLTREAETLLAVPFLDDGTHLRESFTGERWPKHAFLDLPLIGRARKSS